MKKSIHVIVTVLLIVIGQNLSPKTAFALFRRDACTGVTFKVENEVTHKGKSIPITVTKMTLYSQSEGRGITENIKNTEVPAKASQYKVGKGTESIQNAENDLITKITTHFKVKIYGKTHRFTATDDIRNQRCVAGKTYNVTVKGNI